MGSIKGTINQHNARILRKKRQPNSEEVRTCDCRNKNDSTFFPLQENCLETNVVYKAEVSADDYGGKKIYISMTANGFKQRYRNHQKSFNNEEYKNGTELSKHIWRLKRSNRNFTVSWAISSRASAYQSWAAKCYLCLDENLQLIKADKELLLNKRGEIVSTCRHKTKFRSTGFHSRRKKNNIP